MLMLVSYDVNTVNAAGRRRLRRIAKVCEEFLSCAKLSDDSVLKSWVISK